MVLTQAVVDELVNVVAWMEQFNIVGNPIRRYTGLAELRLTVDAGSGVGWRLDGIDATAEVNPKARLVATDWTEGDKAAFQCWNELIAVEMAVAAEENEEEIAVTGQEPTSASTTTSERLAAPGQFPTSQP